MIDGGSLQRSTIWQNGVGSPPMMSAMLGVNHESIKVEIVRMAAEALVISERDGLEMPQMMCAMMLRSYLAGVQAGQGGT